VACETVFTKFGGENCKQGTSASREKVNKNADVNYVHIRLINQFASCRYQEHCAARLTAFFTLEAKSQLLTPSDISLSTSFVHPEILNTATNHTIFATKCERICMLRLHVSLKVWHALKSKNKAASHQVTTSASL